MDWAQLIREINFVFDASHNGIMIVDSKGTILVYNKAAGRVMKRKPASVLGKPLDMVLPQVWPDFERILETGRPQLGLKILLNGITIVANRTPILRNGKIVGVISIFQDLSEYEKVITELETYKSLTKELDAIINSSYDGLYVTDGNANTLRVNKAYERISGLKAESVVGKNMKDLVAKGFFNQSVTLEVLKTRKPVTIMQDIKGGKKVMVTGNPIFDETSGRIVLVVTNVRDVSELDSLRKELENSRQLSERYLSELNELRLKSVKSEGFVAESDAMKRVLHTAFKVAQVDTPVLITGESGVGKGLLARTIHANSSRATKPFIKVNCGAIPETLLESELFGYEHGAFTGAKKQGKLGLFEVANEGTILLDEIGDMPFHLQVKLLSVLEDKQVTRLGGTEPKKIDVRVIAATNASLPELVQEGKFRKDLFFRLNVVPINIPPLRDRKEDIFPLIHFFLSKFNKMHQKKKTILAEALDMLIMYDYPGNIRELQNIVERLVVMSETDTIGLRDLPLYVLDKEARPESSCEGGSDLNLNRLMMNIEARMIEEAIRKYETTYRAAQHLGISQSSVVRKMQRYNIKRNNAKPH